MEARSEETRASFHSAICQRTFCHPFLSQLKCPSCLVPSNNRARPRPRGTSFSHSPFYSTSVFRPPTGCWKQVFHYRALISHLAMHFLPHCPQLVAPVLQQRFLVSLRSGLLPSLLLSFIPRVIKLQYCTSVANTAFETCSHVYLIDKGLSGQWRRRETPEVRLTCTVYDYINESHLNDVPLCSCVMGNGVNYRYF
jgi:hypothetical protein